MSGLAGYARGGQGGHVSKSQKAREGSDAVEKAKGKPFPGAAAPFGAKPGDETPGETPAETTPAGGETTPEKSLSSAVARARGGDLSIDKVVEPTRQPSVPSQGIPGAGPQGVPPAEADELGAFARQGNVEIKPKIVAAQTGLASHGPAIRASLARMGGQVGLAPGQFGVWAHPKDPTSAPLRTESKQYGSPPPAPPVY